MSFPEPYPSIHKERIINRTAHPHRHRGRVSQAITGTNDIILQRELRIDAFAGNPLEEANFLLSGSLRVFSPLRKI